MTTAEYNLALDRLQAAAARRRASAWAPVPERVLGLPLRAPTPATFSLLLGTGNGFVTGRPPTLADVKNFLLYHAPEFDPDRPAPRFLLRFRLALRSARALCPLRTPRARRAGVLALNLRRAIREIAEILRDAFADGLPSTAEDRDPTVAASTLAQFADLFARQYAFWPLPQPIRHTPIAQLMQLARCNDRATLGRHATYYSREEEELTARYLGELNAPALAAAAARSAQPSTPS